MEDIEKRRAKIIISRAGGNASKNACNCKLSIPKSWVDFLNITKDDRGVILSFDGSKITIEKG